MARANGKYLVYAPESGSPTTLKRIKKKIRLDYMERSMRAAVREGIVVRANIIIGFPDESRREILATLRALVRFAWIGVDEIALGLFQPYPGTELFEALRRRGAIELNDDYFETLAHFSTGKLSPTTASVCDAVGRYELYCYRILGTLLFVALSYLLRPARIWRTIHNIGFTDRSSTVIEQRIRDRLRRMRAMVSSRPSLPVMRE
jgi:DNA-binding transcriptional ArsR family regulator